MTKRLAILALTAALSACATTGGRDPNGGAEAIRYHLGQPIEPGTISIEPAMRADADSPEFRVAADAVSGELARLGFQPAPTDASTRYVAAVAVRRTAAGTVRKPPPFSIGIGGGSFGGGRRGGGVGLGGGISTGIGGGTRSVFNLELSVQLRRRSDGANVWEGRARRTEIERKQSSDPVATEQILAAAMFKDFPGESGITINVP